MRELSEAKAGGIDSIIELSTPDLERDVEMIADVARASGMQVVVATIVSDADDYADAVVAKLRAAGLRAEVDERNEKSNYKVREHSTAHVPAILAVGRQEVESWGGRVVRLRVRPGDGTSNLIEKIRKSSVRRRR